MNRTRRGKRCWVSTWWTIGLVKTCGKPAWSTTPSSGWSGPSHHRRTSLLTTSRWAQNSDTGENKRKHTHTYTHCTFLENMVKISKSLKNPAVTARLWHIDMYTPSVRLSAVVPLQGNITRRSLFGSRCSFFSSGWEAETLKGWWEPLMLHSPWKPQFNYSGFWVGPCSHSFKFVVCLCPCSCEFLDISLNLKLEKRHWEMRETIQTFYPVLYYASRFMTT